jgi:hypothetical protein
MAFTRDKIELMKFHAFGINLDIGIELLNPESRPFLCGEVHFP